MLLPIIALFQIAAVASGPVFSGRAGHVDVNAPRLTDTVTIDGNLNEAVWGKAARLTDFSEYIPVDGLPAADSTEVLVWYSSDAIYFGIRAFEAHGAVHATLADRDNIGNDDFVQIFLDTFDDRRRAYVFGVNPLGVQSDGILSEGIQSHSGNIGSAGTTRDTVDLSTDYTYDSRGHVLPDGYEVEIRVPFKSIRIQSGKEQRWGFNILRRVQHSGHENTWAPVRQANSSFLAQSGALVGLTDLDRGHPLELNPELTSHVDGTPRGAGWHYGSPVQQLG
ncbi:MAG: carbohydrate binding family 9 domain-containing protein, partial [Gemmatimonadaceae bacterium]